jgi:hypothetical protein
MTNTKEYQKNYHEKNKFKLLEKSKTPIYCIYCDHAYYKSNMSNHLNTPKHKLNELELSLESLTLKKHNLEKKIDLLIKNNCEII